MDDDIRTMVQRILYVWAQECVVNNDHYAMSVSDRRYRSYIDQAQGGIAGTFNPD